MEKVTNIQISLEDFIQSAYRQGKPSDIVRRSLAVALLQLMQTQDFYAISITELTKTAGVSRMAYYRNYHDKREILQDYMQQIDKDLPYIDLYQAGIADVYDFLVRLFEYLKIFELSTQILIKQGFEYLILEIFNQSHFIRQFEQANLAQVTAQHRYQLVFIAGLLCNTYLHWTKSGQKETSQQLASWIMQSGVATVLIAMLPSQKNASLS